MDKTNNIEQCIRQNLQNYFEELGEENPSNIWNMVSDCVEKAMLDTVMNKANGNQTQAASMLGITRTTLRKKLIQNKLLDQK